MADSVAPPWPIRARNRAGAWVSGSARIHLVPALVRQVVGLRGRVVSQLLADATDVIWKCAEQRDHPSLAATFNFLFSVQFPPGSRYGSSRPTVATLLVHAWVAISVLELHWDWSNRARRSKPVCRVMRVAQPRWRSIAESWSLPELGGTACRGGRRL